MKRLQVFWNSLTRRKDLDGLGIDLVPVFGSPRPRNGSKAPRVLSRRAPVSSRRYNTPLVNHRQHSAIRQRSYSTGNNPPLPRQPERSPCVYPSRSCTRPKGDAMKASGSSSVQLLLTNLRLLDFDFTTCPITPDAFHQNSSNKAKTFEHIAHHLYRTFDPEECDQVCVQPSELGDLRGAE